MNLRIKEIEAAALRELKEECNVSGKIIRMITHNNYDDDNQDYTFFIDIGEHIPKIGNDPDLDSNNQIITDMKWLNLWEIPERDRCFLWASGLIGVWNMIKEIKSWGNEISCPRKT